MDRKQYQRAEFFQKLTEKVMAIPVTLVIGTVIEVYDRNRRPVDEKELASPSGGNYLALCPFHPDERLGSFVITPSKNMWYCFTENIGWNGIHFEMRYYDIGFKDAVFHLARRMSVINDSDYKIYAGKAIDEDIVTHIEKSVEKPKREKPLPKADADVINAAYSAIPLVCRLSAKHKKHLLKDRGLAEADLGDYFTFPTRRTDLAGKVYKEIGRQYALGRFGKEIKELADKERGIVEKSKCLARFREQFERVPGFFYDERKNRYDFAAYNGIGFLVRDDHGRVQGIQIRRDVVKEGETRYVWFSSAFAQAKPGLRGGASSGSPGGVIFPKTERKNGRKPALCITEGRFKAEAIAKKGNIAIYVSGVSTWKSVMPIIDRLKGSRRRAYIMFDADMMGNVAVHSQLTEICEGIKKHGLDPLLILWPKDRGKGFDDLVAGCGQQYSKCLKAVSYDDFEKKYQEVLKKALAKYRSETIRGISKNDAPFFNLDMQRGVEEEIGVKE